MGNKPYLGIEEFLSIVIKSCVVGIIIGACILGLIIGACVL